MKSQYWPELKTFLSIFVSWKNPRYLWLFFSRECVFICYFFPLEHETRSVKFFCLVTPKSCVCNNINWEIKSNSARKIRNFSFLINFTSHAIKRRQHSIERDVDLHVIIECLRKNADTLRPKEANNHRDLQIILKLLFSRQQERRAWIIPTKSLRVTQQMLVLGSSAWKCSMAVSDNNNTILILFSG